MSTRVEFSSPVYAEIMSASTKAFIPHLVGLLEKYWIKDSQPLYPIFLATPILINYKFIKMNDI